MYDIDVVKQVTKPVVLKQLGMKLLIEHGTNMQFYTMNSTGRKIIVYSRILTDTA